jgi:hypothetical protein
MSSGSSRAESAVEPTRSQNRQVASLGFIQRLRFDHCFGWCRSALIKLRDGAQHLAAVPQQYAKVLEILIR